MLKTILYKQRTGDIQRLAGTMKRSTDVGIFVTSGGFSTYAIFEARSADKHIELIHFERFVDLWQQYYQKMTDEDKNMLPLHPIYFSVVTNKFYIEFHKINYKP